MEEGSDIDWKKPVTNNQLIIFALIFFLFAGFIIGFAIGGYSIQEKWVSYNDNLQKRIKSECICINRSLPCGTDITLGGIE